MSHENGLSVPPPPEKKASDKEIWEKALKKALEIALEKPHLDMLRRNGVLPIEGEPWNVIPQKEVSPKDAILPSPKPEIKISEIDRVLLDANTAGAVIQEDSSPVVVATPPQNK